MADLSLEINGQMVCYWCMKVHEYSESECPERQRLAFQLRQEHIRYITEGPPRECGVRTRRRIIGLNSGAGLSDEDGYGILPLGGSEFPQMADFDPNEPLEAGWMPGEGE